MSSIFSMVLFTFFPTICISQLTFICVLFNSRLMLNTFTLLLANNFIVNFMIQDQSLILFGTTYPEILLKRNVSSKAQVVPTIVE